MSERKLGFHVVGRVVDRGTVGPVIGARVEAWDKDHLYNDLVGSEITSADGYFTIDFDEGYFRELFEDRQPDLFFRVYAGDKLIADTETSVLWNAGMSTSVEIAADLSGAAAGEGQPAVLRNFTGQIRDDATDRPLSQLRVQAILSYGGEQPIDLGYDVTDRAGLFTFQYGAKTDKGPGTYRLALQIFDRFDKKIHETMADWPLDRPSPVQVRVRARETDPPDSPNLHELFAEVLPDVPSELRSHLDVLGIRTLADLRRAGGLNRLGDLPVPADDPAVVALAAHSRLHLLSSDVRINARLITNGYRSQSAIAAVPRAEFVGRIGPEIGDAQAYLLHGSSEAQASYLTSIARGAQVEQAEGRPGMTDLDAFDVERCHCRDCEAAVSPLAYLADLLNYSQESLWRNGQPVGLQAISDRFHQPFDRLPAACSALDDRVRQVRICIEVLRDHLVEDPPTGSRQAVLAVAEQRYRQDAYSRLLGEIGTSYTGLRLALSSGDATRERLAQRIGVPTNRLGIFNLVYDSVSEDDLERVFGLRRSTREPLDTIPRSLLELRRLEYLDQLWEVEDWPDDLLPDGRPLIDADLVSPGDFRSPVVAPVGSAPRAFDIWLHRRNWIDAQLELLVNPQNPVQRTVRNNREPDYLATVFAVMDREVEYAFRQDPNRVRQRPWDGAISVSAFDGLAYDLAHGTDESIDRIQTDLQDSLALGIEAFNRLQEIRNKDRRWVRTAGTNPLSIEDRREVASILTQCVKARFFESWREEEAQANLDLGLGEFWLSGREPTEGEWPPLRQEWPPEGDGGRGRQPVRTAPWIDPELVALKELPGWRVGGGRALSVWNDRRSVLANLRASLRTTREDQGLSAALDQALANPASPLPSVDALRTQLNDPVGATRESARQVIEDRLFMSIEAFERLMDVLVRDRQANDPALASPPGPPADTDWSEVDAILTSAHKRFQLYPEWQRVEDDRQNPISYWVARGARLPRWRANAGRRAQWQNALSIRSQRPLVDPDVLRADDFMSLRADAPPVILLRQRADELRGYQDGLRQTRLTAANPLAGFDAICRQVLHDPSQILLDFDNVEREGHDLSGRLGQLGLVRDEYEHMLRLRQLLANGEPVLDTDWSEVEAILTRVYKQRQSALWRGEERQARITVRLELFRLVEHDPFAFEPSAGSRHEPEARRSWRALLTARIEQQNDVLAATATALSALEEALLPDLRDALILATSVPGRTVEAKSRPLADRLLIDTQAGGCQTTTRISQAIATLQLLLWRVRAGQLPNSGFQLHDDRFDERWVWIGSYATWRAATFVHLYPENVLMPVLRRTQTAGFRAFIAQVRQNRRRITPSGACQLAQSYEEYYSDILSLQVEASCYAPLDSSGNACESSSPEASRTLAFLFARAPSRARCYWSRLDPSDEQQTSWELIEGLGGITAVLGALPFRSLSGEEFILVFVKSRAEGSDSLLMSRYSLSRRLWTGEPIKLDAPDDSKAFNVVVKQQRVWGEWRLGTAIPGRSAPLVVFQVGTTIHFRFLDADGTNWSADEFSPMLGPSAQLVAAVSGRSAEAGPYFLFFQWNNGAISYTILAGTAGPRSGNIWPFDPDNAIVRFAGALLWPNDDDLFIFWKTRNESTRAAHFHPSLAEPEVFASAAGLISVSIDSGPPDPNRRFFLSQHYESSGPQVTAVTLLSSNHQPSFGTTAPVWLTPREDVNAMPRLAAAGGVQGDRRDHTRQLLLDHLVQPDCLAYIEEYYYFVPLQLAFELQGNGQYMAALDWFRTVYDYTEPVGQERKIWHGLVLEETLANTLTRLPNWLSDPLNPHAIALTRRNSYTRFTLLSMIRCLLAYADDEYTRDTAESLERARTLYYIASDLLDSGELQQQLDPCSELIGTIDISLRLNDPLQQSSWRRILEDLRRLGSVPTLSQTVADLLRDMEADDNDETRLSRARVRVDTALMASPQPLDFTQVVEANRRRQAAVTDALVASDVVAETLATLAGQVSGDRLHALSLVSGIAPSELLVRDRSIAWLRAPSSTSRENGLLLDRLFRTSKFNSSVSQTVTYQFCVAPNPLVTVLRWHVSVNLRKLSTCRNIAGLRREVEPYAAATDQTSGLPVIGGDGTLMLPGLIRLRPTLYRYEALIAKAKELVQMAAQIEAAMLAAIEKSDAERYLQLKARQDVRLMRAGLRLQQFRVKEALGEVNLAELYRDRAQFQMSHFNELLGTGYSALELSSLVLLGFAAATYGAAYLAARAEKFGMETKESHSYAASALQTTSSLLSQIGSYERRREEWEFQRDLAALDIGIGNQQVQIAQDHVQVVGQEEEIARIEATHAEETATFLSTKFSNADLYDWMSNVLEDVYSFFLQQATSTGKLAVAQLAFERQEIPPSLIQDDYWEVPDTDLTIDVSGSNAPDRRGLTGSARLLRDLHQVEQYAFETRQRKSELTQTFSLARLAPIEFARFLQEGELTFATPMELFDRAFPGHYLRQIRNVKISVIALIPPVDGIHAVLASSRISRIVIGPEVFQTVRIERGPEQVALTLPRDATGLLDLEPQSELLRPFEGIGVDTLWEFRMPRAANQFDYRTIADLLMTIEYTALDSFDYREQVIRALSPTVSADRPFSFRHQFADAWYDLHNPELTTTPMTVRFKTLRADFPANVDELIIQHIALFFARKEGAIFEVEVETLSLTMPGGNATLGGGATSIEGLASTRRNAPSWVAMRGKPPVGEWQLVLPNTVVMRNRFKNEDLLDMLFVVTYSARTPQWTKISP